MRGRIVNSGGESPPHGEGSPARCERPVSLHDSLDRRQSVMDTGIDGEVQRIQEMLYAKASNEPEIRFNGLTERNLERHLA